MEKAGAKSPFLKMLLGALFGKEGTGGLLDEEKLQVIFTKMLEKAKAHAASTSSSTDDALVKEMEDKGPMIVKAIATYGPMIVAIILKMI